MLAIGASACTHSAVRDQARRNPARITPSKIKQVLAHIDKAIFQTVADAHAYTKQHAEFAEIGERMLDRKWWRGTSKSSR